MPDLTDRRVIVTGGSSGVGAGAVGLFAEAGAQVLIASREPAPAEAVAALVNARCGEARVSWAALDLSSLASVRRFAEGEQHRPIDVLVNNAGVMARTLRRTEEGFEWNLAVNHLGHFLLAVLLAPRLPIGTGRVVQLTSGASRNAPFDFDDPNFQHQPYEPDLAYGRAKAACSLFAVGFSKRFRGRGLDAFSVTPGVVRTALFSEFAEREAEQLFERLAPWTCTAEESALSIGYAATAPELRGRGGLYIEDCAPARLGTGTTPGGVMPHAVDSAAAERLWLLSEQLAGVSVDQDGNVSQHHAAGKDMVVSGGAGPA